MDLNNYSSIMDEISEDMSRAFRLSIALANRDVIKTTSVYKVT
jgi:hypothetical protein